jgi:threonyl-tRNA synthetase
MAHILAQAILRIYPNAKLGIGPVVEDGFYYEVDIVKEITEKDFPRIEEEMWSIVKSNYPITQILINKDEAYNLLLHQGQIYKTEILGEIQAEEVSLYKTGDEFIDLCSGPHLPSTANVGFFKLTKIEEGNWRNMPSRPVMKKIYGVGFLSKKDLLNYLEKQEKLKESDHRKLGQEIGFYTIHNNTGLGMPLWLPKGAKLRNIIFDYLKFEKEKAGYSEVFTPTLIPGSSDLLNTTSESINKLTFPELIEQENKFILRTEKTPMHYQVFKFKNRSYRELPFRIYEHGYLFRNESEHELHGLTKTRIFTGETNHIFCTEEQLFQEILTSFQLASKILSKFGLSDYKIQLSIDSDNNNKRFTWSVNVMLKVIETLKLTTRQIEDKSTENGPKLELFVKDLFGKEWQISSIQLDIFSTLKQKLHYINKKGKRNEVIVIRSTFIGSVERLIGLILEKTLGNLPLWLSPEQVRVLPISQKYRAYAENIQFKLQKYGFRVGIDPNDETLQYRIKESQQDRIPYMVIVGSKEESSGSISIRPREGQDLGLMKLDDFTNLLNREL